MNDYLLMYVTEHPGASPECCEQVVNILKNKNFGTAKKWQDD